MRVLASSKVRQRAVDIRPERDRALSSVAVPIARAALHDVFLRIISCPFCRASNHWHGRPGLHRARCFGYLPGFEPTYRVVLEGAG